MNEFNAMLMLGFTLWALFCAIIIMIDNKTEAKKWKRAAKTMELHAKTQGRLATQYFNAYMALRAFAELNGLDTASRADNGRGFERSIPKGVITHDKNAG